MSFWLRCGWLALEADSEKKQARYRAGSRVRRWFFESMGLGRLGDTDSVSTGCGDKEGMKHHLRNRNNWSIAAQTQWDHQPPVSTRTQPGKWAVTPESGRERKKLLGPVLLTKLWLSSRAITIQAGSSSGIARMIHFVTANMALTVTCLIVMGSCGGSINRNRQKTQCTLPPEDPRYTLASSSPSLYNTKAFKHNGTQWHPVLWLWLARKEVLFSPVCHTAQERINRMALASPAHTLKCIVDMRNCHSRRQS